MARRKSDGVWLPAGSQYWYMDFRVGKKRITGSTRRTSRKEAVACANRVRQQELTLLARAGTSARRDMSLAQAFDLYMAQVGQYASNAHALERALNWILDQTGEKIKLTAVDDALLAELVAAKRQTSRAFGKPKPLENKTVNAFVTELLRAVLHRARSIWKIPLPDEPTWSEHLLPTKARTRELTFAEEDRLLAEAGDTGYGALIRFVLASGLRKENAHIRWEQVDWDLGIIRVTQKGGSSHEVQITPTIKALLDDAAPGGKRKNEDFVFTRKAWESDPGFTDGIMYQPIRSTAFVSAFRRFSERAGVKDLHIHDLRRTAGARLYRRGVCIGKVQVFLGHANLATTRKHYIHITPMDVRDAVHEADVYYSSRRATPSPVRLAA